MKTSGAPATTAGWVRSFLEWFIVGAVGTAAVLINGAAVGWLAVVWGGVGLVWLVIGRLWVQQLNRQRDPSMVDKRCLWCDRIQTAKRGSCTVCPTCQADMVEP